MLQRILLGVALAVSLGGAWAAEPPPCRVLDPELQGQYSGGCKDGLADGLGAARGLFAEYTGQFSAGKKQGVGTKLWVNGDHYVGAFLDDRKEGYGIYVWGAKSPWPGERYLGQYRNDQRHGLGVYEWPNGDRYEGEWEQDRVKGLATPMQTLQHQRRQAVVKALSKPGTKVCKQVPVGIGNTERLDGVVLELRSDREVLVGVAGPGGQSDSVLDDPINWEPCY